MMLTEKEKVMRHDGRGCCGNRSGSILHADAKGFEESNVVGVDGKLRRLSIPGARADQLRRGLYRLLIIIIIIILTVEADGSFQDQKDVISLFLDLRNHLGDLF